MRDIDLQALIAIVQRETAMVNGDVAQFGQPQWNPVTESFRELCDEYERRARRRKLLVAKSHDEARKILQEIVSE